MVHIFYYIYRSLAYGLEWIALLSIVEFIDASFGVTPETNIAFTTIQYTKSGQKHFA